MQNFDEAKTRFLMGAQIIVDLHYATSSYHPKLSVDPGGKKYLRVVRADYPESGLNSQGRSVHCFIDTTNGDVLMAAGWKAPAKHARGNIFDEASGLAKMGPYGPAYLR